MKNQRSKLLILLMTVMFLILFLNENQFNYEIMKNNEKPFNEQQYHDPITSGWASNGNLVAGTTYRRFMGFGIINLLI